MLLPRFLTALVGVPLLIGAVHFGSLPYFFMILGISILALREFYFLAEETGYPCYSGVGLFFGALVTVSVFLNGIGFAHVAENQATAAILSLALIVVVLKSIASGPRETSLSEWSVTITGIFYVTWTLSHLLLLRDLRPAGKWATFYLFVLVWVADMGAYWVGSHWGRHPIAETISPKKTWEGTFAGVTGGVLVGLAFKYLALPQLQVVEAILLSVVTALLAFFSDLGESVLKRGAGVKDSSLLLPGHGGVLDRFDSFMLSAPFFYYYWAFLKH